MSGGNYSSNITLPVDKHTEFIYELSKTATEIAVQNFEWRYITLVLFNATIWHGVEYFLKSYGKVISISNGTFYPKLTKNTRQYVLFGFNVNDIEHTLDWITYHKFDNTGKYIIVCQSLNRHECDEGAATQVFWEHKVTNVIFLNIVEHNVTGFTYFPLDSKACHYYDPVRLVNLTMCLNSLEFEDYCNMYPIKLNNLHGCPIIASTFKQPPYMVIEDGLPRGADGDLVRLFAEKLNANISVMTPHIGVGWGVRDQNGSWTGSLADVYYDYANFSITSGFLTQSRVLDFQISIGYNPVSLIWMTHSAKIIPPYVKLAYPFQQDSQIALIISFIFVILCSLFIRSKYWFKLVRTIKIERPRSGIVFYSWMVCMGLPTTKLPTKTALLYVVIFWMWYCVLIRTFYQVSLISALKSNFHYGEFETLNDALNAEYPFGGGISLKDFYLDYPEIYNKWTDLSAPDIAPTLRKIAEGKEFVLTMNMATAKTIIWKEKLQVHILSEKIVTCESAIFFKKYSPLADSINRLLTRLVESGFTFKTYRDNVATMKVRAAEDFPESIKLQHYAGCYGVLVAGWIISFLSLIAEIIFDKIFR